MQSGTAPWLPAPDLKIWSATTLIVLVTTHTVRAFDQTSDFLGFRFHSLGAPNGKDELPDHRRTLEPFVLKPFLEPTLNEEQDAERPIIRTRDLGLQCSTYLNRECAWAGSSPVESNRLLKISKRRSLVAKS